MFDVNERGALNARMLCHKNVSFYLCYVCVCVCVCIAVCRVHCSCDIVSLQHCVQQLADYKRFADGGLITYTESEVDDVCRCVYVRYVCYLKLILCVYAVSYV